MGKVCIRTYGCQMNDRDSEVIAGLLSRAGYELTDDEKSADIIIFNTCAVRQHAEDKVWSEIGRVAKQRRSTKPIIGLVGCMAQNYKAEIFKRSPAVDFAAGPSDIAKIPEILNQLSAISCQPSAKDLFVTKIWETDGNIRPEEIYHTGFYRDRRHAYVVISEGCSNYCSYCVVPYVRGELHNRDYKDILKEIREAVGRGITGITLLGQSVNAYDNFIGLLKSVNDIEGLEEFTFITSHPKDTSVELFRAMAQCGKLKKYLHLPVQSGSDKILKLMNRGYTKSQYLKLADEYRKAVPGGMVSTDVIVGFPGETEADFLETFDLMKKVKFDSAYLFKYSPRAGTQAEGRTDDVPEAEKKRRHKILLDYQKELHKNQRTEVGGRRSEGRGRIFLSSVFCLLSSVFCLLSSAPSWAALDIFDRPKDTAVKTKIEKRQEKVDFLSYPKECLLKGDYNGALESLEKLFRAPAAAKLKGDISYLVALSLLKLDRFLEARRYFNDVLLIENASDELKRNALLGIADSYMVEQRYDRAKEAYKKILSDYPDSPISCAVYFKLAEALTKLDENAEAKYYLDKVRTEFPFSFEARLAGASDAPKIEKAENSACEPGRPDTSGNNYYVQAGVFSDKHNSDRLCEELVRQGFDAYISKSTGDHKTRYRVKVGKLDSRSEALQLEKKLKRAGYSTKICP